MTRKLSLFAAFAAMLFFTSIAAEHVALARRVGGTTLTTVTQPDQWCQGGSNQGTANTATEVCLDFGGHFVPTTTGVQKLGSSSLQWLDVETVNINSGGGALAVGAAAHQTAMTSTGLIVAPNWTLAQIRAYTPVTGDLGGLVTCTNCASPYAICQATGTLVQGFRAGITGTTECK